MTNEIMYQIIWVWVYAGVGAALFSLGVLFASIYLTNKEKNNDREGN